MIINLPFATRGQTITGRNMVGTGKTNYGSEKINRVFPLFADMQTLKQQLRPLTLVSVLSLAACDAYEPPKVQDAHIQLAFENSLDTLGSARLSATAHGGNAGFKTGKTGKSLYSDGEGSWVEFKTTQSLMLGGEIDVSFDFKRSETSSMNTKGRVVQTIAVISSIGSDRIRHVTFNIANRTDPHIYVNFDSANGKRFKLHSSANSITNGWHNARLLIDVKSRKSRLFLDGKLVDSIRAVSSVFARGIDRIKLGTWHKKNQAYRGQIDNFVIL
ncbi:MAG: hypothetical protein ACR2PF_17395 [Rhizobiaceae bacterium]